MDELPEHVARIGEMKRAKKGWVRKPEGRKPIRKYIHILKDNIKLDLKGTEWRVESAGLERPKSEVFTVVKSHIVVSWVMSTCSLVEGY